MQVSSESNNSAISSWSFAESVSTSSISCTTLDADGTSLLGNNSSSKASESSVRGNNTLNSLSLMALATMLMSVLSSEGKVDTSRVFIFCNVCFNKSVVSPVSIFSFILFIRASRSMIWSLASCWFITAEKLCSSHSSDDFLVALGMIAKFSLYKEGGPDF